jgi:hypothetical protein
MENLSRYAVAGSKGKGMLTIKYIFCESNCSDDDIAGFAYAMLALRPQQLWLTLDFSPLFLHQWDHDYSAQIEAYAKLYLLLKKHGMEAFQYYKEAIATYSQEGKDIMEQILSAIERQRSATPLDVSDLLFRDFRNREPVIGNEPDKFAVNPLRLVTNNGSSKEWLLDGQRVLLVPACPQTQELLSGQEIQKASWIGFVDRNPIQQGKTIDGKMIYSYEAIPSMDVDVILVAAPEKHRTDILSTIARYASKGVKIMELADSK